MNNLNLMREKILANKDEMIKTLQELVQINSEAMEPKENMPFGEGVAKAFAYTLKKAQEDGFEIKNVDNFGGHIDLLPGEDFDGETIGILGHLDVVPAGNDWDLDAFSGEIKDGKIFGRGTADDKGPTLAGYYAMKAIKDAAIPLKKKVRLILGLDEETGWKGMDYYLSKEKAPNFGIAPDADFPAVNGEKGILIFDLVKKFSKSLGNGLQLRSIKGGNAANMVADYARAVVYFESSSNKKAKKKKTEEPLLKDGKSPYDHIKEIVQNYKEETGHKVKTKGVGKSFEIAVSGISAHGANPQEGLNAISILMEILGKLEFENESVNEFIEFYNKHIGFNLNGEDLGIDFEDELSGETVVNVGMIDLDKKSATLTINVRFPVSFDDVAIYNALDTVIFPYNIGVVKKKYQAPIYMEPNEPFIETLMEVYRRNTGDLEAEAQVIGGGTYARAADGFVAYGAIFPGEPELAHQKNEYISIDSLVKATIIYAEAIYELCK